MNCLSDTFGDLRWSSKSAPLSQHFFAANLFQQICFVKELLVIFLSLYIYIYTQQHCLHLSSNLIEPNLSNGFLSKLRSKATITLYIVQNMYQGDFPLQFLVDPSDGQFFSLRFTCSESLSWTGYLFLLNKTTMIPCRRKGIGHPL